MRTVRQVRLVATVAAVATVALGTIVPGAVRAAPPAGRASAPSANELRARAAFVDGQEAYAADKFSEALAHFSEAYRLSRRSELLYNLGLCQERLGQNAEAVASYRLYLTELPKAPDRSAVEARVEFLTRLGPTAASGGAASPSLVTGAQAAARGAAQAPALPSSARAPLLPRSATDAPKASGAALPLAAAGSAPPASTGRAAAEPRPQAANPQPALASTGAAAEPIVRATPPPASDVELTAHHASDSARPLGRRPWFIGTMAGIGAVALGAVVVGVVVGTAAPASVVLDRVDTRTPQ